MLTKDEKTFLADGLSLLVFAHPRRCSLLLLLLPKGSSPRLDERTSSLLISVSISSSSSSLPSPRADPSFLSLLSSPGGPVRAPPSLPPPSQSDLFRSVSLWADLVCTPHIQVANWGLPLAALADMQKDASLISGVMTPTMAGYSSVHLSSSFSL